MEITTLLVMETNRYYHGHFDRPSPLPDVTKAEMLVFLRIMIQMRETDRLLVNDDQFHTHISQ